MAVLGNGQEADGDHFPRAEPNSMELGHTISQDGFAWRSKSALMMNFENMGAAQFWKEKP